MLTNKNRLTIPAHGEFHILRRSADTRAKTITLTAEGRAVSARMEERLMDLRARVLKGVSREDLETTLRVLNAFNAALDATVTSGKGASDETAVPVRSGSKRNA